MKYFDNLSFEKGIITVLGVNRNSDFVVALSNLLKDSGSVLVTDDSSVTEASADYVIYAPDSAQKAITVHTEEQAEQFAKSHHVIGVMSVTALQKVINEVVDGYSEFCAVTKLDDDELVFPSAVGKVVSNREKYTLIYINDVNSEGRRYLARETAKYIRYGAGIRMINTDSDFVETLVRGQLKNP